MNLYISLEAPYRWVTLNSRGQYRESGVIDNLENYRVPKSVEQVIGVAPGDFIACHSVYIPGKNKRNAESALGYALEDKLTDDIDDIHFKLVSWDSDGTASAIIVSKEKLSAWLERFRFNGINMDQVIPEYFLLPLHPKGKVTISENLSGKVVIRADKHTGISLDQEGFEYWWSSQEQISSTYSVTDLNLAKRLKTEVEGVVKNTDRATSVINHWKIGSDFSEWLLDSSNLSDLSPYNLLEGSFTPSHATKSANIIKIAATIAVLGILIKAGSMVYEIRTLEAQKADLNSNMKSLFLSYFPDQPYLDRPRSQVSNLISAARQGVSVDSDFQVLLSAIAEVTLKYSSTVDEINYRDGSIVAVCRVSSLSSLDTIILAFNELPQIQAELLSSGARDGVVTGRFKVTQTR